jgi:hypothetical protein
LVYITAFFIRLRQSRVEVVINIGIGEITPATRKKELTHTRTRQLNK